MRPAVGNNGLSSKYRVPGKDLSSYDLEAGLRTRDCAKRRRLIPASNSTCQLIQRSLKWLALLTTLPTLTFVFRQLPLGGASTVARTTHNEVDVDNAKGWLRNPGVDSNTLEELGELNRYLRLQGISPKDFKDFLQRSLKETEPTTPRPVLALRDLEVSEPTDKNLDLDLGFDAAQQHFYDLATLPIFQNLIDPTSTIRNVIGTNIGRVELEVQELQKFSMLLEDLEAFVSDVHPNDPQCAQTLAFQISRLAVYRAHVFLLTETAVPLDPPKFMKNPLRLIRWSGSELETLLDKLRSMAREPGKNRPSIDQESTPILNNASNSNKLVTETASNCFPGLRPLVWELIKFAEGEIASRNYVAPGLRSLVWELTKFAEGEQTGS